MIKYLELTAPDSDEFRQVKIVSIEVAEGDQINQGDTLFMVKRGDEELALPSTLDGKVMEVIALVDENISLMTPLILLETRVSESTATPATHKDGKEKKPDAVTSETESKAKKTVEKNKKTKPKSKKKRSKKNKTNKEHEQQSLNLSGVAEEIERLEQSAPEQETPQSQPEPEPMTKEEIAVNAVVVPDIGGDSASVVEILVNVGDSIELEQGLITLESDKASMEVPSSAAGVIQSIEVELNQEVNEGTVIVTLIDTQADEAAPIANEVETSAAPTSNDEASIISNKLNALIDVQVPDIGGDSAKVIEILVKVGDQIEEEQSLITLESDKASMDVPSSARGVVDSIEVQLDQDVNEGTIILRLLSTDTGNDNQALSQEDDQPAQHKAEAKIDQEVAQAAPIAKPEASPPPVPSATTTTSKSHASPSIRRFARELGVDLSQIVGSGRKSRIKKQDVKAHVKQLLSQPDKTGGTAAITSGAGIPEVPAVDFSRFGKTEISPLNKIKRLTAQNLHRSWLNVPHVTHSDEANINDLDSFRKQLNAEYASQDKGIKLSPLAFIVKAVVKALQNYPQFNASLEPGGENLILKKYFNVGIAVDTPNGLVVPVIKNAETLSVAEIADAMKTLSEKARDKKLSPSDMSGACFTISSLGGIGGTNFTPIVNAPEVAILGVSRSKIQPVWNGTEFEPGMMLPLSLSYDHRVIDGAEAARFTRYIATALEDVRRLTV